MDDAGLVWQDVLAGLVLVHTASIIILAYYLLLAIRRIEKLEAELR